MIGLIIGIYIVAGVISTFTNISKAGVFGWVIALPLFPFWLAKKYYISEKNERRQILKVLLTIVILFAICYLTILAIKNVF